MARFKNGNLILEDAKSVVSDTSVGLSYAGVTAINTQSQGIVVRDTAGNTPAIEMRNYLGTLQGRIIGGTTSNLWQVGSGNEDAIKVQANGAVELYYNDGKKFETASGGFKCIYTAPSGFKFYDQSDNSAIAIHDSDAVELHYNGGKSLATTNNGIDLFSGTDDASLYVSSSTQYLILAAKGTSHGVKILGIDSGDASTTLIEGNPNNAVDLYYDGSLALETTQFGATIRSASTPSLGLYENDESGVVGWCWANTTDTYVQHEKNSSGIRLQAKAVSNDRIVTWDPTNGGFYPTLTDAYTCGISGNRWSDIYAQSGSVNTSDEREKTNITDSTLGLNFIEALTPVSFKFKDKDWVDSAPAGPGGEVVDSTGTHTYIRTHYGLIAQDVKTVMDTLGIDTNAFAGYIHNEEADFYGLRYHEFISPMIKSIQELKAINEAQQIEINDLISRVEALEGA